MVMVCCAPNNYVLREGAPAQVNYHSSTEALSEIDQSAKKKKKYSSHEL